tara:strand:+ start:2141 stop:2347 length:207 start_codon:yes stop_codon:yes gene_type:complete
MTGKFNEDIALARDVLIDLCKEMHVDSSPCHGCGANIWDDFELWKASVQVQGALTRVEKAMEMLKINA